MVKLKKAVFVIQASPLEWTGALAIALRLLDGKPIVYWVIEKLKQIASPSQIVLAVPDISASEVFSDIARETGVHAYWGLQNDVLARLIGAVELCGGDIFAKVIGQQYFIDCDLLKSMITWFMNNNLDYGQAPDGFDVHLWGEIAKLDTLKKVYVELSRFSGKENASWRTRPLSFVRMHKDRFKVGVYDDVPLYSDAKLLQMREVAKKIYIEERSEYVEADKTYSTVGNVIIDRYRLAQQYVGREDRVLDIACGLGYGSALLAQKTAYVVGADYSPQVIQIALEHYRKENLSFEIQDITAMSFPNDSFDVVVCMETICHVDEIQCLSELRRVLKPKGTLVISSHQNMNGKIPIVPWHLQEYSLEEFKHILNERFVLCKIYGEKLGVISEDERGEYMIAVCKNDRAA